MSYIYLPVEICSRELMSRAYLATNLAKNGHSVYIFEHTLFDRLKWPSPGIYIGKNCFRTEVPYLKNYYKSMKKSEVDLWFLDEEGGIYSGNSSNQKEILTHRLEVNDLDERDKVLTWGNWQKKVFDLKTPLADIVVSGSPCYDIFQDKYKKGLMNWDLEITEGRRDFILINTRFSQGNPKLGAKHFFNSKQPHSEKLPKMHLEEAFIADNRLLFSIVELCLYLAKMLPNKEIVIRPHPGESVDIYKYLTKKFNNVSVIYKGGVESWVRMSKVIIHNGCSTAIQSIIAKKNVITFVPKNISTFENMHSAYLPNTIGRIARTHQDVFSFINKSYKNDDKTWEDTISRLDSIEFISKLVDTATENKGSKSVSLNSYGLFFGERLRDLVRVALISMFPNKKYKKFDYREFSRIVDLVELANSHYKTNVKCKKITNGCYCIYKKV
jgi:surface carbohydrate biosynthesis protein